MTAVLLPFLLSAGGTAFAGSATWNLNPTSSDWNTAANWTPPTVPNGPSDTATFGVSNTPGIYANFLAAWEVNGIVFNPGASAYTITYVYLGLTISGVGITNNSGITQNLVSDQYSQILFTNNATAGNLTAFSNGDVEYGHHDCCYLGISFFDTSSAGSGTFTNLGSDYSETYGAGTSFYGTSTAANGTFINYSGGGGNGPYYSGSTSFNETSTASNATLIAYPAPGNTFNDGGHIYFSSDSTGGTARVEVFGGTGNTYNDGVLDISGHNPRGVTVGSIEGTGSVFLGANSLTVGSNNLSTIFSGLIQDGGLSGGAGGSLTKVGSGMLVLTNANLYTGGTTIEGGKLVVNNRTGSGTGTGLVQVNGGTLGGKGTIAGPVILGTGSGPGAVLSPGKRGVKPAPLTIQSALTFNSDSTYNFGLKTNSANVVANGVTINGALFSFAALGVGALPAGTVFTVINNTATTPISGTFSNLPDGSTFTVGSNTFQTNYEGGDGNDLTLTVVP